MSIRRVISNSWKSSALPTATDCFTAGPNILKKSYFSSGTWGSYANREDLDHRHVDLLEGLTFQPIFIMGDHRTGTTILYKILGVTECFNIVTAYHIIKYNEILHNHVNHTINNSKEQLAALFAQKGLKNRQVDSLPLNPYMPEEYGYILKNTGFRQQLGPNNLADLLELSKKVQLTSDPTRPLLLKNPWDYFLNFMYVKEAFPDSKFIFIHRHPISTINSQLKTIRAAFSVKNEYVALIAEWYDQIFRHPLRLNLVRFLFSSHFDIGLRVVTRHVVKATNYFLGHIPLLPQKDYVCVRYEDLCRQPELTVTKILESFRLSENAEVEYGSLIDVRPGPLLSEVKRKREAIFRKLKPYFDYCGYQLEVDS